MIHLPRNCQIWLPGYLNSCMSRLWSEPPKRVWLTFADHFEPLWHGADERTGIERVAAWSRSWPEIASRHHDSAGRPAQYTFFYPQEEYRPFLLDPLAAMAEQGIGDVEVHIHHDGEGEQDFVDRISTFADTLYSRHNLLRKEAGQIRFGFIHGNWALDNSGFAGRHCGLNNELSLLVSLGCYADFTLPAAPEPSQSRLVNTIYWAVDDPERPKSHDTGMPAGTSTSQPGGSLLMIPGPLALRWEGKRWMPRLERGEISFNDLPTPARVAQWLRAAPRIGSDVFIKLFTHGTQERNSSVLLSGALDRVLDLITEQTGEWGQSLYFVTAAQMRDAVEAVLSSRDPVLAIRDKTTRCVANRS